MYAKELVSPCGLYCGVCGIRKATMEQDRELKEKLSKVYGVSTSEIHCHGCRSDQVFVYCRSCPIKSCAEAKKLEGCYQCGGFPCQAIDDFPFPEAKANILRTVPRWRALGTEEWIREEESRYRCQTCGTQSFRGARKCRQCQTPLV